MSAAPAPEDSGLTAGDMHLRPVIGSGRDPRAFWHVVIPGSRRVLKVASHVLARLLSGERLAEVLDTMASDAGPADAAPSRCAAAATSYWFRAYTAFAGHQVFADIKDDDGDTRRRILRSYLDHDEGTLRDAGPPSPGPAASAPEPIASLVRLGCLVLAGYLRASDLVDAELRLLRSVSSAIDLVVAVPVAGASGAGTRLLRYDLRSGRFSSGGAAGPILGEGRAGAVVLVADFARYQARYRHDRALRHLWIEAGFIVEQHSMAAEALGLEPAPLTAAARAALTRALSCRPGHQQILGGLVIAGPRSDRT